MSKVTLSAVGRVTMTVLAAAKSTIRIMVANKIVASLKIVS
jgi:hypothetical protein